MVEDTHGCYYEAIGGGAVDWTALSADPKGIAEPADDIQKPCLKMAVPK
jgi:hypothetical protein